MSHGRFFALVDGVFAIATTLLVLELRVPAHVASGQLSHTLSELRPSFVAYAIGFLQTFGGWSVSHRLSARLRGVDQWMILSLGLGLAFVSLIPFSTSALAVSFHDEANFKVAVALVSGLGLLSTLSLVIATVHAYRAGYFLPGYTAEHHGWLVRLMIGAVAGFAVAFALSFVAPGLALVPVVIGYAATLLPLRIDEFPCVGEVA
ncbi:MAG: potassium channel family protein [Actinomycetota bacterium]